MARFLIATLVLFHFQAYSRDLDKQYEKTSFRIGNKKFAAYVADDQPKRSEGLMFIERLPEDTGMLFVFESEQPLSFWMKNTLIPLSIGFFDSKANLIDIQEMQVAASLMAVQVPTYHSRGPAVFALEMTSGWFTKNKIKTGAKLESAAAMKSSLLKSKLNKSPARQ